MNVGVDTSGTLEGLRAAFASVRGARSLQVLAAIDSDYPVEALDALIASSDVPVFGGLFPAILHDGSTLPRGAVVIGHDVPARVTVVDCTGPIAAPERWAPLLRGSRAVAVYVDGTCPAGPIAGALARHVGGVSAWFGGGAGTVDLVARPSVITPGGVRGGVAVLAGLDADTRVALGHGWRAFGPALLVTESVDDVIVTLDGRPALEAYREVVEAHAGARFDDVGFAALALAYPLLLERFGAEGVVREPLAVLPGGALQCAGAVQENSAVRVATSTSAGMLGAAREVRAAATPGGRAVPGSVALTLACVSRADVLGARFGEELEALRVPGVPQVGALTLSEISCEPDRFLEVHNRVSVLAVVAPTGVGA